MPGLLSSPQPTPWYAQLPTDIDVAGLPPLSLTLSPAGWLVSRPERLGRGGKVAMSGLDPGIPGG